jgi:hypothetical protein
MRFASFPRPVVVVIKLLAALNALTYGFSFALSTVATRNITLGSSPYATLSGVPRARYRSVRTDRNRPVVVRYFSELTAPTEAMLQSEERWLRSEGLDGTLVRTGESGPHSNCYGWVFTGGRFALDADIDQILTDNDYSPTREPRPDDLAVYRDGAGQIVHVGIVRAVQDGEPLVESKWGARGRYHHPASVYGASSACGFYRSSRHGHLLRGIYEREDSPQTAAVDFFGFD